METYSTSENVSSGEPWQTTAVSQPDRESDDIHYVPGMQQVTSLPGSPQGEATPLIAADSGRGACEMVGGPPQTTSKSKNSLIGQISQSYYIISSRMPKKSTLGCIIHVLRRVWHPSRSVMGSDSH